MKSLEEYSKEKLVAESGELKAFLKKAWNWLIGNKEDKYNPTSHRYNEKEKIKYINKFDSKDIEMKDIDSTKILVEIVKKSLGEDDSCGFFKLNKYFRENPQDKVIDNHNRFLSLIFKTDKLTESCALIGYKDNYEGFEGQNVVYITEFLDIYRYLINFDEVAKKLKEIDENIIIIDSYLISQFEKEVNDVEIEKIEDKKDAYRLV